MMGSGFTGVAMTALAFSVAALPGTASAEPTGKPANICKELVAFLHPAPAPAPANAAPAQSSTAVSGAGSSGAQKPAADGDTQKNSGLSGPTSSSGPGASGPQGTSQGSASPSAAPAAAPAAATAPAPKAPSAAAIERGDAVAGANDIAGCQRVAREIRRDGVVMPAPLMSLAALDLKYHETAK